MPFVFLGGLGFLLYVLSQKKKLPKFYSLPHQYSDSLDPELPTLTDLAKTITGNEQRWIEVPAANPGMKFQNPPFGMKFKLPKDWSYYFNQFGEVDGRGTRYPMCGTSGYEHCTTTLPMKK